MNSPLAFDAPILVVDDESFALTLAARMLNKLGYQCITSANSGSTALQAIDTANEPFQLILCDLNMPEMDGLEFLQELANLDYLGAIILLSGEDQRMLETASGHVLAQNLNVLGAISKPLKPEPLLALLQRIKPHRRSSNNRPQHELSHEDLRAGIAGSTDCHPVLVYQPKVNIASGEITSVETLARWQHPDYGLLGPNAFIAVAERSGLIDELTKVIYRQAVAQTVIWHRQGFPLATSVNISINSFATVGFSDFLVQEAEDQGLPTRFLCLEATETQVMENALNCTQILMRLRLKKFGLSIDDFGTGNSSMSQLMNIPFTELKIDRSFVNGAAKSDSARAILETSVALGKRLQMSIVAEGVETREDWDLVQTSGCDYVQGYYCSKPISGEQLTELLNSWTGPH
ncbi:EAL domain-containing protein [Pseudohongiella sp. O18]|uniref:EAL domain-containing response regulator n=1 Tax=Pseudohongiella sp. O18 TaxID=2904248 RepID=UPI001F3C2360|nr:EAL domain-containing response regulator [Pseudohongiella sp. O18]